MRGGNANYVMVVMARGSWCRVEVYCAHGWNPSIRHLLYQGYGEQPFGGRFKKEKESLLDALLKGVDPGKQALETVQSAIEAVLGSRGTRAQFMLPDSDNQFRLYVEPGGGRVIVHVQSFDRGSGYQAENMLFYDTEDEALEALAQPGMAKDLREKFYHLSDVVDDKKD